MATIEDLSNKSISEMTSDEAIEYLRQIRLSRRTPKARTRTTKTQKRKKATQLPEISADLAKKLLEKLKE